MTLKQREEIIKKIKQSNKPLVIFSMMKISEAGLNAFTKACNMIIVTPGREPPTKIQLPSRCFRHGQKKNVTITELITENSLEVHHFIRFIAESLANHHQLWDKLNITEEMIMEKFLYNNNLDELKQMNELLKIVFSKCKNIMARVINFTKYIFGKDVSQLD